MKEEKDFAERVIALGFDEPADTSFFMRSEEDITEERDIDFVTALSDYFQAIKDVAEQLDLCVATYVPNVKISCKESVYKFIDSLLNELESLGVNVECPIRGLDRTLRNDIFEFPRFRSLSERSTK